MKVLTKDGVPVERDMKVYHPNGCIVTEHVVDGIMLHNNGLITLKIDAHESPAKSLGIGAAYASWDKAAVAAAEGVAKNVEKLDPRFVAEVITALIRELEVAND